MKLWRTLTLLVACIIVWQSIVMFFNIPAYLLPPPLQVVKALYSNHNVILTHSISTSAEILLGFMCGSLLGCTAGLIITFYQPLGKWFLPILIISQAIPTFAIAPFIVIWLGYGVSSKIAVTALMIFFPITSTFYDGLKNTPQAWLDLAKSMNANRWRTFLHIKMPAALPSLASGLRIAAVSAPLGAVIGEWVGSSKGLGYLMLNANARMQIDMMFAVLLVMMLLALALYLSVDQLLRRLVSWPQNLH